MEFITIIGLITSVMIVLFFTMFLVRTEEVNAEIKKLDFAKKQWKITLIVTGSVAIVGLISVGVLFLIAAI